MSSAREWPRSSPPKDLEVLDEEWQRFLLPITTPADIIDRGLKLKNLQAAYIRNLVANLGGRAAIQPTKLADALGCSYNTLSSCLRPYVAD